VKRSLLVLPDDSAAPIVSAIQSAKRSICAKMFVLSDRTLLGALIAASRRSVKVRVMLNAARRNGGRDNDATRKALLRGGTAVKEGNPDFDLTHEKSMIVDDEVAFVQSCNWAAQNFFETRDYAVITDHRHEVAEISDGFEADWHRQMFDPSGQSQLIWCPNHGRAKICRFIDEAKHRLFVQNERFQDIAIIEHLVRAVRRGVKVHVMARASHTLKRDKLVEGVGGLRILDDVGVKVHQMKDLRLHGKILLADGVAAIVGSINFAAGSLDGRRELAIQTHDERVVGRLQKIVHHDWQHSRALDLSNAGLLADLEGRIEGSAELLGLKSEHL
jgi:phosphatidylserine/phosphatidylglycerophosphate/cardiolipin synthase-like enzyme